MIAIYLLGILEYNPRLDLYRIQITLFQLLRNARVGCMTLMNQFNDDNERNREAPPFNRWFEEGKYQVG